MRERIQDLVYWGIIARPLWETRMGEGRGVEGWGLGFKGALSIFFGNGLLNWPRSVNNGVPSPGWLVLISAEQKHSADWLRRGEWKMHHISSSNVRREEPCSPGDAHRIHVRADGCRRRRRRTSYPGLTPRWKRIITSSHIFKHLTIDGLHQLNVSSILRNGFIKKNYFNIVELLLLTVLWFHNTYRHH